MIIQLETQGEEVAAWELSKLIQSVIDSQEETQIAYIRGLWDNDPWEWIVQRFQTEGSTWYVWWMDGVRAYMQATSGG